MTVEPQKLIFGDEIVATPTKITFANEKLWSKNAGRTSSCLMVGDIRAIKKTVHIEWAYLTPAQVKQINRYISSVDNVFWNMTFLDEEFESVTKTVYAGTPSYEQWGWDRNHRLCKVVSIDLVEQ